MTGFGTLAEREGFMVAYPQADSPNPRFDASQAIWSFFRTQARGR